MTGSRGQEPIPGGLIGRAGVEPGHVIEWAGAGGDGAGWGLAWFFILLAILLATR